MGVITALSLARNISDLEFRLGLNLIRPDKMEELNQWGVLVLNLKLKLIFQKYWVILWSNINLLSGIFSSLVAILVYLWTHYSKVWAYVNICEKDGYNLLTICDDNLGIQQLNIKPKHDAMD